MSPLRVIVPFGSIPEVVLLSWKIGDIVRKLREDRGWTQRQFAAKAGMALTAANRLEQNSDLSDQRTIMRAAQALEVPISLLYRYAEFTSLFAELNEAQQGRVLELMREFALMNSENPRPGAGRIPDATPVAAESARPAQARRRS